MRYAVACRFTAVLIVVMSLALAGAEELVPYWKRWDIPLKSLDPKDVLTVLDLDRAGLEKVKHASDAGDRSGALKALLDYYRGRFPPPKRQATSKDVIRTADNLCRHVFQWGPYQPATGPGLLDAAAKTFSIAHPESAPAAFVTILMPYRGQQAPEVNAELEPSFEIGSAEVRLRVEVADKSWRIGRNIADGSATAR